MASPRSPTPAHYCDSLAFRIAGAVHIDIGKVDNYDTAGLQLLLMARASARAQGKELALIAPAPSFRAALERIGVPAGYFD
jgi:anti-anti-sigma regulatory factor